MSWRTWLWATVASLLMISTAALLGQLKNRQRVGEAGVRIRPLTGESLRAEVCLPEVLPGFRSEKVEVQKEVIEALPADTSFGQRLYRSEDGFEMLLNVVLMGTDRTSIHKPQFCLVGSGWRIDQTIKDRIPIGRPIPYELPVIKLLTSREMILQGGSVPVRGVYVYWYVCADGFSGDPTGLERLWSMARTLALRGELQRWAYVTCFAVCAPGQEQVTYDRIKAFLALAVPEFQTVPNAVPMGMRLTQQMTP